MNKIKRKQKKESESMKWEKTEGIKENPTK